MAKVANMDLLDACGEAFDVGGQKGPPVIAVKRMPSGIKDERCDDDSQPPPAGRKRLGHFSDLDSPPPPAGRKRPRGQNVKQESASEDDGCDEKSECPGCGRTRQDCSWFDEHCPVAWAFRRGKWCRDCHTVWRSRHSSSHGLSVFGRWLLREHINKVLFQLDLLAWISLVGEGEQKVTAGLIATRVALLRWLMRTCRIDEDTFLKNVFRNWPAELRTDAALASSVSSLGPSSAIVAVATAGGPSSPTPATRLEMKFKMARDESLKLLRSFSDPAAWSSVKESLFSKLLHIMLSLRAEAHMNGDEDILTVTDKWSANLSCAKRIAKLQQALKKCKGDLSPIDKLVECTDTFSHFAAFCREAGVLLAAGLRFQNAQACFHSDLRKSDSVLAALRAALPAIEKVQDFDAPAVSKSINPNIYFGSLFAQAFASLLEKAKVEGVNHNDSDDGVNQEALQVIGKELGQLKGAVAEKFPGSNVLFTELYADIEALACLVSDVGDSQNIVASVVEAAVARRNKPGSMMRALNEKLKDSPVWSILLANAGRSIHQSAMSTLATAALARAMQMVQDERLPHISLQGANTMDNLDTVLDGTAVNLLTESLEAVLESLASESNGENVKPLVLQWFEALLSKLSEVNLASWVLLGASFVSSGFADCTEMTELSTCQAGFEKLAVEELQFHNFVDTVKEKLAGYPLFAEAVDAQAGLLGEIRDHAILRNMFREAVEQIFLLGEVPEPEEAVKAWQADGDESFLGRAVPLVGNVRELAATKLTLALPADNVSVRGENLEEEVDGAKLPRILIALHEHPLLKDVQQVLHNATEFAFSEVVRSLHMATWMGLNEVVDGDRRTSFYSRRAAAGELAKIAEDAFGQSRKIWPFEVAGKKRFPERVFPTASNP